MDSLIHPTYFPNIAHFFVCVQSKKIVLEIEDNYQKQTYRNRTYIYGANGKLQLSVPVIYTQKNRQKYKDVKIFNDDNWQSQHWKSLESAYRTSPFFEFYEDELRPLFEKKQTYILDFNMACFEVICDCLQLELAIENTTAYNKEVNTLKDYRFLVNSKKEHIINFEEYIQVFNAKHGYINNLSILDLLFNEGTNAVNYLENQKPDFQN